MNSQFMKRKGTTLKQNTSFSTIYEIPTTTSINQGIDIFMGHFWVFWFPKNIIFTTEFSKTFQG